MKYILLLLACSSLLAACNKNESDILDDMDFQELYGGRPYRGTAKAIIKAPSLSTDVELDGDARIVLMDATTDSVSIVFMADFKSQGEVNLKLRGKINGPDFQMEHPSTQNYFTIRGETMDGKMENPLHIMAFAGRIKRELSSMQLNVQFKEEDGIFPKGSTLNLEFETSRKIPENSDDGTGCQMKVVPIWGPNGMSMGMVPDC